LTQLSDNVVTHIIQESRAERLRIQQEAEEAAAGRTA